MSFKEEFIFWRLANFLIIDQGYRMIQLFENQELWLEKTENRKTPIVRLLLQNIDWSNRMKSDIELTALNGEKIRKQIGRSELTITNIYISPYPPVDEYEFLIAQPYVLSEGKKTAVNTILMAMNTYEEGFHQLSERFDRKIAFPIEPEYSEEEIAHLKDTTLHFIAEKRKAEEELFKDRLPFFTYTFIFLQVAVFIWMQLHGGSTNTETLIKYGAKVNALIYEGEWWRFITPIFIHIGFLHLASNTLALYFLGIAVEKLYGNIRFLFIYLFAGITGFIASFLFSPYMSAGASGAIFGCFGALLYFGAIYPKLFARTMGRNVIFFLILNLVIDFTTTGMDNAGHIGGLIGGFLASGIVYFPKKKKLLLQFLFLILSAAVLWGSLAYGFSVYAITNDQSSSLMLAQDYIKKEQYAKAYTILKDAENKAKNPSSDLYFQLSYIEIKQNKLSEAKSHLLMALKLQPNFDQACYNLALIYLQENDLKDAKYYAEQAAKLQPNQKDYSNLLNEITNQIQSSQRRR